MPWSSTSSSSSSSSSSPHMIATRSAIHKKIQEQQSAPVLGKHEITTKKFQPTKLTKLTRFSDIASNPLIVTENSMEISEETPEEIQDQEEQEEQEVSASVLTPATTPATTPPSKKRGGRAKKV
ncbi:hypothetical protein RhiirC2_754160 [Rhizophagus irregularis]|uniref:Uncharacterized protein n=1 Tax=Rhizophagus irregularis TaxID=588596 RepID=A0A2N1MWR7_9GLOM|nr:hypothetical protein RhiirC2_754160 [Rhizophagus irregularis]